jgi:hypothetical protein
MRASRTTCTSRRHEADRTWPGPQENAPEYATTCTGPGRQEPASGADNFKEGVDICRQEIEFMEIAGAIQAPRLSAER